MTGAVALWVTLYVFSMTSYVSNAIASRAHFVLPPIVELVPSHSVDVSNHAEESFVLSDSQIDTLFERFSQRVTSVHPKFVPAYVLGDLEMFLISGFFDSRTVLHGDDHPRVFAMALTRRHNQPLAYELECVLRFSSDSEKSFVVKPEVFIVPEHNNRPWVVSMFYCPLDLQYLYQKLCQGKEVSCLANTIPTQVAFKHSSESHHRDDIVWMDLTVSQEMLDLLSTETYDHNPSYLSKLLSSFDLVGLYSQKLSAELKLDHYSKPETIYLCTAPIRMKVYENYLVHWVEFYKALGVEKIVTYDSKPSHITKQVMDLYQSDGFLEVYDWPLPSAEEMNTLRPPNSSIPTLERKGRESNVHDFGQIATHADCILRTAGRSRWTLILDFDEFLVAQSQRMDVQSLIQSHLNEIGATQLQPAQLAGFHYFAFFYKACNLTHAQEYSLKAGLDPKFIPSLFSTSRAEATDGFGRRTKFIVDPLLVDVMGIHSPFTILGNFNESNGILKRFNSWSYKFEKTPAIKMSRIGRINKHLDRIMFIHPDVAHCHHIRAKFYVKCVCEPDHLKGSIENSKLAQYFGDEVVQGVGKTLSRLEVVD